MAKIRQSRNKPTGRRALAQIGSIYFGGSDKPKGIRKPQVTESDIPSTRAKGIAKATKISERKKAAKKPKPVEKSSKGVKLKSSKKLSSTLSKSKKPKVAKTKPKKAVKKTEATKKPKVVKPKPKKKKNTVFPRRSNKNPDVLQRLFGKKLFGN